MRKIKKSLVVILTLALLTTLLTACGNKEKTGTGDTTPTAAPTAAPTKGADGSGADTGEATETPDIDISEHVTLTWYLHGSNVKDDTAVLAKANEYLKEKLNVTIKPIWGTWGDFDDNVILSINGGDDVDIYFTCSWSSNEYNSFAKRGAWVRLDDPSNNLIEKYAPDIWAALPDLLKEGAKIEGNKGLGVYAIPGYKDLATQNCWDINVTLLNKYGYTIDDIKNTDYYGFGEILQAVKDGEEAETGETFYPLLVEGAVLERMVNNSIIVTGDAANHSVLSYYLNPDDVSALGAYGNTVLNKFATPEYKKFVEQTREYYLKGFIDPAMGNAQQANTVRTETQLAAQYLIGTQSNALGYDVMASSQRGIEVAMVPATEAYVDTTSSQGAMMAVSATSKNKERAVMFLNLLNTDPYLMTLLEYGIEGVHYELVNGGEVRFNSPGERDNYQPWTNGMGNVTQLPPLEGQGLDFQEEFKAFYNNSTKTPILGWALVPEDVVNELSALAAVEAEYAIALNTGIVDPAVELPKFLEKLEANGIQKVVDEANKQLNDFLASKGQ